MKKYSAHQFAVFRIVLGVYLVVHFGMLIPYASDIWSSKGSLPVPSLNLTYGVLPNLLNAFDSPGFVTGFVVLMLVLSISYALGFARRTVAVLLWYGWACLFNRNNFISNPGIPFVGWLLLASAIVPLGEPLTIRREKEPEGGWEMPKVLFLGAWFIMMLSYSISGFDKLGSPSWAGGMSIPILLDNPLARDTFLRTLLLSFPLILLKLQTWFVLALELLAFPLALFRPTRKWIWLGIVGMHLGILCIVDFADLTTGMLMIHLFTYNPSWFPRVHRLLLGLGAKVWPGFSPDKISA